jgi:hypothetical protein
MQNYKDLVLENEIGNIQMVRPIKGISIVEENPIGVLEKLGKYEFIYDYQVPNPFFNNLYAPSLLKGGSSNTNQVYNFDGDGTGGLKNISIGTKSPYIFQTTRVNSDPQVGTFSKGNIVNVIRFDGNNAIIQNPNFLEPAPDAPVKTKWDWTKLIGDLGDLKNQKEFTVPKDYLRKVDDNLAVTVSTGILYGANMKPQPVIPIPPYKPLPNLNPIGSGTQLGQVLETNVTYTISKPFQFIKSYTNVRPLYELGGAGRLQYEQTANYETLPIGMEVTGNLIRQKRITGKSINGMPETSIYYDVLLVSGMGQSGQLEIPVEYLTKKIPTNIPTNNGGVVVPAKDNNKNILMIVGAFLLGYVLFGKDTPTT